LLIRILVGITRCQTLWITYRRIAGAQRTGVPPNKAAGRD